MKYKHDILHLFREIIFIWLSETADGANEYQSDGANDADVIVFSY